MAAKQPSPFSKALAGCQKDGDCQNGHGVYLYENGDRYEGEYKNGKRHGQGVMEFQSGKHKGDVYKGGYSNGVKSGRGLFTWSSGNTYEGEYKDGEYHGHGVFKNGKTAFVGKWKEGAPHGYGVQRHIKNGTIIHDGVWRHGAPYGPSQHKKKEPAEHNEL